MTTEAGSGGQREFEFEQSDNEHFSALASAMRFVGVGAVVIAVLIGGASALAMRIAAGSARGPMPIVYISPAIGAAVLLLIVGFLNVRAAGPFTQIHTTTGRDIANLMQAFERLRSLFRLLALLFVLGLLAAISEGVSVYLATSAAVGR